MIKKIKIKNINSIGETEVSFEKGRYQFNEEMVKDDIVNPIAIYGTNGSGKTSFLKALEYLVGLMIDPVQDLKLFNFNILNISKYIMGDDEISSEIHIDLLIGNDVFTYILSTYINSISNEKLIKNNQIIFDRNGDKYVLQDKQYFINVSMCIPILRLLYDTSNPQEDIKKVYEYLSNIAYISSERNKDYKFRSFNNIGYWDLMVRKSEEIKDVLKNYKQFPVYSFKKYPKKYSFESISISDPKEEYLMEIEAGDKKIALPADYLSGGMFNQSFILTVIFSLPENGLLVVDELEQALHPSVIRDFIKVVQERNIQLIFSSHNTNILSYLRPDQIFFSKWKDGYSSLKRLSDFHENIRAINNIEKMYLSHLFDEDINND